MSVLKRSRTHRSRVVPGAAADAKVLRRFRAALDELYGDPIERVVVFGSCARGMRTMGLITISRYF